MNPKASHLSNLRFFLFFSLVPYTLLTAQEKKESSPPFLPLQKKEQASAQNEKKQAEKPATNSTPSKPSTSKTSSPSEKGSLTKGLSGNRDNSQNEKEKKKNAESLADSKNSNLPKNALSNAPSLSAQNDKPANANNGQMTAAKKPAMQYLPKSGYSLPSCDTIANRSWLSAQHREAKGIGYNVGYSTLELFLGHPFCESTLGFVDLRGHIFNSGKWAANGGIGLRHGLDAYPYVVGINAYYDYREASHSHFDQIGGGLELLAASWDLRLNGYIPLGGRKHKFEDGFSEFKENRAIFAKHYEFSYYGGDLDLGYEFVKGDLGDLHGTLGGYYFYGEYGKNAKGGFLKLNARITPYVSLEAQGSYDNLFHWIGQGALAVNVPFGGKALRKKPMSCMEPLSLGERLVEPVARFEIIVKNEHKKKALAVDPITGEPLFFLFVDNELGSSDGTFEHPYPTLAAAETASSAGDTLYVFAGDGTTTGMDVGITLKDNQHFLGSGVLHTFSTRFGMRDVPAQTNNLPSITRTGGDTVTLADNNVVRGFNISGTAIGIIGASIQNGTYANNTISTPGGGMLIDGSSNGVFTIRNNTITNYSTNRGIIFSVTSSTRVTAFIENNHLTGTLASAGIFSNSPSTSNGLMVISNNSILDSLSGINLLPANTSDFTYLIDNNTIANMDSHGIDIETQNNTISNIRIYKNSISSISQEGILCVFSDASLGTLDIQKNTVLDTRTALGSAGTRIRIADTANIDVRLFDNDSFTDSNGFIGYSLVNDGILGSLFQVQSPDTALNGVALLNDGSNVGANTATKMGAVSTTGTISYIDLFLFNQSP